MSYDPFLVHMENRSGCCEFDEPDPLDTDSNLEQTIRSAVSTFYHTNLCSLISERIGDGEPLDVLLRDTYMREKLNLTPRKL